MLLRNIAPQTSNTISLVAGMGSPSWGLGAADFEIASLTPHQAKNSAPESDVPIFWSSPYVLTQVPNTFDQTIKSFFEKKRPLDIELKSEVSFLYTSLLNTQEPLGKDFSDVLEENIWDLLIAS